MNSSHEYLQIRNLNVRFSGKGVISNLNLEIASGEIVALLGKSGIGKSTLLRAIVREVAIHSGEIHGPPRYGYAPQRAPLLPWLNVLENLKLAKSATGDADSFNAKVQRLLLRAKLDDVASLRPAALSGGMRSRVNILRAFLTDSPVVLMDEPFVGLDAVTHNILLDLSIELWQESRPTIIIATHDIDEALKIATRIIVFREPESTIGFDRTYSNPTVRDQAPHFADYRKMGHDDDLRRSEIYKALQ